MDEQSYQQMAAQLRRPHGGQGIATGEWMNRGNMHINRDTLQIVNAVAHDNILEMGMGNGFFVKELLQRDNSIRYTGVDFSELMINEAKKINEEWISNGQAAFVLADMLALPFTKAAFNKIFTINTIYFWEDPTQVLSEITRVLVPGGKFILTLRPKRLMENYPFTKYGFNMFSKEEAEQLLLQNDFILLQSIEKQEPDFELNGQLIKIESLIIEAISK
jgi:ubiquinone/menaquinone biosynthesis C-methylase UbiE